MQFICRGDTLIHIEYFKPYTIYCYDKSTLELKTSQKFPNLSHLHMAQDYSCFAAAADSLLHIIDVDSFETVEIIDLSEFDFFTSTTHFVQIKLASRCIAMLQTYDTQRDIDTLYWVDLASKTVILERLWKDASHLTEFYSIEQDFNVTRIFWRLDGSEKTIERKLDHRESDVFPTVFTISPTQCIHTDGYSVLFYDAQTGVESDIAFRWLMPCTTFLRFGPLLLLCTPRSVAYYKLDGKTLTKYAEWMLPTQIQQAKWYQIRFALDDDGDVYVLYQRREKKIFKLSIPV
eukprot:TRINITY_DN16159_c0_g1_i1.p1 TRINITY_DN16159_c0_g1~~TRINITY_DN16159_c0_g1_i1.p1  ORF type:complete len:290 (-),score=31.17 TRINITY_DN16159_c0_g1_i1:141-1010(-)